MERPQSIITFERCYLGALAIGIVNTALNWSRYSQMPQVAQANAAIGEWYLPVTVGLGFVIPLILWYFIARRASVVAKWIMVVFTAIGLLGILFGLMMGSFPSGLSGILSVVALVLNLIAAVMLFRPDAREWFGERFGDDARDDLI